MPLLLRQAGCHRAALWFAAVAGTPVNVGPGVARIVQDGEHVTVDQLTPEQSRREPAATAARKLQSLLAELLDDRDRRAQPPEGLNQQADALLHLLVRIENHPRVGIVKQADGQGQRQLAAPDLVQQPALHAQKKKKKKN